MAVVTIADIRAAGHCVRGAKTWFAGHRLDFAKFLREGIGEEELLATNDSLAVEVIRKKRERHG